MTEKPFFEVFRTLEVDNQTRALFEQVVVTRVSTSPSQDVLRVYITSKKLIAKNQLFHLAKQIQRQIFGYRKVQVLIFEKFQLSSQYTPQKLWSLYEDSVLTELEAYSPYKRSILKNAAVEFPDEENVLVGISSKVYDKDAVEDIIRILDRVFNERCGFRVKVDVEYREPKESVSMEKSEAELQQRISFLSENLRKEKAAKQKRRQRQKPPEKRRRRKQPQQERAHRLQKLVADRRAALPAMVEALAEAAREDPSVPAEATAEAITRMYSMEEILKVNRSRWNRCRKRWEKSLLKARSSMWKNGRSVESVRSLQ